MILKDQVRLEHCVAHLDLAQVALCKAESETRRQAASDFTRALMERFEGPTTAIITRYINAYLQVRLVSFAMTFVNFAIRSNMPPVLTTIGRAKTQLSSC